jgi:hypothetical protein
MGIRETLNRNPAITTGATIAVIVIALIVIFKQIFGGSGTGKPPTKAFYTTDDGATTFVDEINLYPPIERDGKPAVRAYKFKCADGKEFISYLERYTPKAKAALEAAAEKRKANPDAVDSGIDYALGEYDMTGREIKRPNDPNAKWINAQDPRWGEVASPKCADGKIDSLKAVYPQ